MKICWNSRKGKSENISSLRILIFLWSFGPCPVFEFRVITDLQTPNKSFAIYIYIYDFCAAWRLPGLLGSNPVNGGWETVATHQPAYLITKEIETNDQRHTRKYLNDHQQKLTNITNFLKQCMNTLQKSMSYA